MGAAVIDSKMIALTVTLPTTLAITLKSVGWVTNRLRENTVRVQE